VWVGTFVHVSETAVPEHDEKDWTWVLEQPCPECGFVSAEFDLAEVGFAIRFNARAWVALLEGDEAELRAHRRADRWSDLEYGAHVRDVFDLYLERFGLMLTFDDPLYPNWDQNQAAIIGAYNGQTPHVVALDLAAAAGSLADAFEAVAAVGWGRTGRRSDEASFTVESFARHLVHDPVHHPWDVNRG
jgi:hypothetical protein